MRSPLAALVLVLLPAFAVGAQEPPGPPAAGSDDAAPSTHEQALARADRFRAEARAALARGESFPAAAAWHEAGQIEFALGELRRCAESYAHVRELARELDHAILYVLALSHLGAVRVRFGEPTEGYELLREAVRLVDRLQVPDAPVVRAFAHFQLGEARLQLGDLEGARTSTEETLELARGLGDRTAESALLSRMGEIARLRGGRAEALDWHRRAVATARGAGNPAQLAFALLEAANFHRRRGDYAETRACLDEALDAAPTERARMSVVGALGDIEARLGDPLAAGARFERVLEYARASGARQLEVTALLGMGQVSLRLGEHERAEARLRAALARVGAEAAAQRAEVLRMLARVRMEGGDAEGAGAALAEALALAERSRDPFLRGSVLSTRIGWQYLRGEHEAALESARRLRAIGREHGSPEVEAAGLRNVAELCLRLDRRAEAREPAERAAAIYRELGDSPQLQSALLTNVELAWRDGDVERMASIVREAEACLDDVPDLDPERGARLRAREEFALWGEVSQDLVALALERSPARASEVVERGFRRAGLWKGRALWQAIAEHRGVDGAGAAPEALSAAELAALLGPDRVLVDYVEGRRRVYAYVLRGGELRFHDVGDREAVRRRVDAVLAGMTRPDRLAPVEAVCREGAAAYRELLAPLLAGAPPDAGLVVVPCAALAALPFEALVVDAPATPSSFAEITFVLDRREVAYVASTPVLALLAAIGPRAEPGSALVLADAVFAEGAAERAGGGPWSPLPGTRAEALAIVAELEAAATTHDPAEAYGRVEARAEERSVSLEGRAFRLYLGAEATPERLAGDLRGYAIVHCATHGWVDPQDWRRTGLVLSPDATGDAVLSLAEVLALELDADLTVLSACETARGGVQRSEGVQSLARAFQFAGSRSVVASLWPVEDRATQRTMSELYARCGEPGTTVSRALREARLAVRRAESSASDVRGVGVHRAASAARQAGHPYFWASFVLFGPPGAPVPATAR